MAPDRGQTSTSRDRSISAPFPPPDPVSDHESQEPPISRRRPSDARIFLASRAREGQNFTVRGILVGLGVGLIICFSNMYFGLQTGWISSMSSLSALIGFGFFKSLSKHLDLPFTPVENVLVQSVAGSMGTMPLGCGFVGVMPALNYMLSPEEHGPIFLNLWMLILWALGICFFGVFFAVPLRRQVIIREKLKFPSGTATALMIGVLHGNESNVEGSLSRRLTLSDAEEQQSLIRQSTDVVSDSTALHRQSSLGDSAEQEPPLMPFIDEVSDEEGLRKTHTSSWKSRVKLLLVSFTISGLYTFATYFFPMLRNLPVFGNKLATAWLWTFNPSLAYVGQGIIMGPSTTTHMLLGAIVGWGLLSPLAKAKGWAPGAVDDWETGARGYIVWISLAIMLSDSVVSLGHITLRLLLVRGPTYVADIRTNVRKCNWKRLFQLGLSNPAKGYAPLATGEALSTSSHETAPRFQEGISLSGERLKDLEEPDAPPEELVNDRTVWIGLALSVAFCVASIRIVFGSLVPLYATILAVFMALILSIMGVRALGETDLNPVSGISKLAQLFFALVIPQSNKNSVLINLLAGAVSESGALQAGDLMQDLKTGHLLGAAPNAQFWGQMIGSAVGAVVSALIYKLYTDVYNVPGDLFQVPTAYVWIFTARLVTGKGLPTMAAQWALGSAVVFTILTVIRIWGQGKTWHPYLPGGIAVAVGMYNVPSFTLARAVGGFVSLYWRTYKKREETPIIILASGLILGEGVMSITNLILASMKVPHL